MGGDAAPCEKDHAAQDHVFYRAGLNDFVRAVSVLHCLGKNLNNFETINP